MPQHGPARRGAQRNRHDLSQSQYAETGAADDSAPRHQNRHAQGTLRSNDTSSEAVSEFEGLDISRAEGNGMDSSSNLRSTKHAVLTNRSRHAPSNTLTERQSLPRSNMDVKPTSPATLPPQRWSPAAESHQVEYLATLSRQARDFFQIPRGNYQKSYTYLSQHFDRFGFDRREILQEATNAIINHNTDLAEQIIQQLLLYLRWAQYGGGPESRRFFAGLLIDGSGMRRILEQDLEKVYNSLMSQAQSSLTPLVLHDSSPSSGRHDSDIDRHTEPVELSNILHLDDSPDMVHAARRHIEVARLGRHDIQPSSGNEDDKDAAKFLSRHKRGPTKEPLEAGRPLKFQANRDSDFVQSDYVVMRSHFFVLGRIMTVIWHEASMANRASLSDLNYGREAVYSSSVQTMVVVKKRPGCSWCLPIYTYGLQGLTKRGVDVDEHAIVYAEGAQPERLKGEPFTTRDPIEFAPASPQEKLHPSSRINFGKVHTVEHNTPVRNVGLVTQRSLPWLLQYFKDSATGS